MKKYVSYILILIFMVLLFSPIAKINATPIQISPQPPATTSTTSGVTPAPITNYKLLAPLPNGEGGKMMENFPLGSGSGGLSNYLNIMIKIFIGICAVLAVIMIVVGGMEYMTSELISNKEHGKERITNAIFGLILALGAYTLLYTINPNLLNVDLSNLKDVSVEVTTTQLKNYTGQGTCSPVASSSNPCSVGNLTNAGFTNATQASSICNGESGGVANLGSGVDKGSDGNPFSFGLFQINIIAHANEIPGGVCSNIFKVDPNPPGKVGTTPNDSTLGGCLQKDPSGQICVKYAATVVDKTKYQSCVAYITNPTNNIAYAAKLQTSRNWNQWGANASCRF